MVAIAAALALPASGLAANVPPGNSAATQYTEAFPTAGGQQDAENKGKGSNRHPAKALGADNAQRLESQGPEGRAAAEIAAETAPVTSVVDESSPPAEAEEESGGSAGKDGGNGGNQGHVPDRGSQEQVSPATTANGSSGLGEVIAHASGASSSDQTGLLLPLLIGGALAWSLVLLVRQRRRPSE